MLRTTDLPLYANRQIAGEYLAELLVDQPVAGPLLVLALPRGGVPVAFPIAQRLNAPLDVFLVRKLGVPGHEELAMGAIASGGVRVVNREIVQQLAIPQLVIDTVAQAQLAELERRESLYRLGKPPAEIQGHHVILVDDGLATGASMRAAVRALRHLHPAAVTVAVPVGAGETCEKLRREVRQLICGQTPEPFAAVGRWYASFPQTHDEEVISLLNKADAARSHATPHST